DVLPSRGAPDAHGRCVDVLDDVGAPFVLDVVLGVLGRIDVAAERPGALGRQRAVDHAVDELAAGEDVDRGAGRKVVVVVVGVAVLDVVGLLAGAKSAEHVVLAGVHLGGAAADHEGGGR